MKKERIVAIIPAAGSGDRLGTSGSKPFVQLGAKPILIHTLEKFQASTEVTQLVLVVRKADLQRAKDIVSDYRLTKVTEIIEGGASRQESVYRGLQGIGDQEISYVLIHDGVRPFLTVEKIHEILQVCRKHKAVILAVKPKDTLKQSNGTPFVRSTLDRTKLWSAQTPQAFAFDLLLKAHQRALDKKVVGTDDASLVERLGVKVKIVEGSYDNIKITTLEDLELAELILRRHLLKRP